MVTTILALLENAEINLRKARLNDTVGLVYAQQQLKDSVILLKKGYSIEDDLGPILEKYNLAENVPENTISK